MVKKIWSPGEEITADALNHTDMGLKALAQASPNMTVAIDPGAVKFAKGLVKYAGGNSPTFIKTGLGGIYSLPNNPSNGNTMTLTINGTAITINFVSSIGSTAGNVLIGATIAATLVNLLGLLQNPGTTSSTQRALSAGNQTLVGYFSWRISSTTIVGDCLNTAVASLTTFTGATNVSGGSFAANTNPRIDLVTIDNLGVIAITQGLTAASPTAPACPSGKAPIVEIYMTSGAVHIDNVSDATNAYINADARAFCAGDTNFGILLQAGEAITPGKYVHKGDVTVYAGPGASIIDQSSGATQLFDLYSQVDGQDGQTKYVICDQKIQFAAQTVIGAVRLKLRKQNASYENQGLTIAIMADNGGNPNESSVLAQINILNSALSTTAGDVLIDFGQSITLAAGTPYHITVTGATGNCHVYVYGSNTSTYADGDCGSFSHMTFSSWSRNTTSDLRFELLASTFQVATKYYMTTSSDVKRFNWKGVCAETVAADGYFFCNLLVDNNQVGLTPDADYYLDVAGGISVAGGTAKIYAGKAIDATTILLDKRVETKIGVKNSGTVNLSTSPVKITMDTEDFDHLDEFDKTTNRRFTPKTNGFYLINLSITGSTSWALIGSIYKNGSAIQTVAATGYYSGGSTVGINLMQVVYLTTSDYIEFYSWVSSSSSSIGANGAYASIIRIK